jgi:hypothetical protein
MIEALMYFGGGMAIGLVARMIYEEWKEIK